MLTCEGQRKYFPVTFWEWDLSIYQCIEKLSYIYRNKFCGSIIKNIITGSCVDFPVVFPTMKVYSLLAPTLQTMDWKPFRTPSPPPESPPATPPPPPWTEPAPAPPAAPQVKKTLLSRQPLRPISGQASVPELWIRIRDSVPFWPRGG